MLLLLEKTRVTGGKNLSAITNDFEYVDSKAISGVVELLVQALAHVGLLDRFVNEGRDNRLRVPVGETMHNSVELFIRVNGSIASFLVLERSIGVDGGLCSRSQCCVTRKGGKVTHFAAWPDSSSDKQQEAYHREANGRQQRA